MSYLGFLGLLRVYDTPASGCGPQYKIPFVETHPTNYVECISAPKYYKDLSELQYFKDRTFGTLTFW